MKQTIHIFFVLLLLLFSGFELATAANDKNPQLNDIIVTTSNTDLLLFATVENCFTPEMVHGVQNGIAITFTFHVELDRIKSKWFDSTLVDTLITHTLTYDSLKEEYSILRDTKGQKAFTTESLEEAKLLMSELNGLHVIPLERLIPDAPYALHIKATLEKNTLPLGMHYVLPFTSLWDFETDWRTIEFRY